MRKMERSVTINNKTLDLLNTEIDFLHSIEDRHGDLKINHNKYKLSFISKSLDTICEGK